MNRKAIIIVAVVVVALLYFTKRWSVKFKDMKAEYQSNVRILRNVFPDWVLRDLEKVYRLETAHFKSGQFKGTYAPGMHDFSKTYPYGWNTISRVVWEKYPQARPTGEVWTGTEGGTGLTRTYLKFPNLLAAMTTTAGFIAHYKNPARWYSTDPEAQQRYANKLANIKSRWTDEVLA